MICPALGTGIDVIGGSASEVPIKLRVRSNSAQTPVHAQTLACKE